MSAWLVFACRLLVGGVFIYASADKLVDPAAFAQAVHHYRLVPAALLHPFALYLPMLELVIGVALIAGLLRRGAALVAAGLTVVFMLAITAALARGLDISCGCFDTDAGHAVGLELLLRDVVLLALCLPPLLLRRGGPELDTLRHRRDRSI